MSGTPVDHKSLILQTSFCHHFPHLVRSAKPQIMSTWGEVRRRGCYEATERYGRRRRGPLRKSGEKDHVRFTKRVIEVPETSKKNGA